MTKNVDMTVKTPFMQQQKMLMYVFPVMFAVFGINFPVGVLVYWLTTNVWTMGQQMVVIRRNPTPGSLAFKQRQDRLKAKGQLEEEPAAKTRTAEGGQPVKRQQPKRQTKSQRQHSGPAQGQPEKGAETAAEAGGGSGEQDKADAAQDGGQAPAEGVAGA